jgi:ParB-like chromosome segregation protein Spo0J
MRTPPPNGEIHSIAAMFPLLSSDELADLADDIAANGQIQPIVLDGDGTLVDGRNRLAACEKAGVEPKFAVLPARFRDDVGSYVLAANITRRQLNAGQRAALSAKVRAVCDKPLSEAAKELGVSKSRLAYASVVLNADPGLLDDVIAGDLSLDSAYIEVRRRERAEAERVERERAKHERPKPQAPTLHPPRPNPHAAQLDRLLDRAEEPAEDLEAFARWAGQLIDQVVVPLGEAAARCAEWSDATLAEHPLPDEIAGTIRRIAPPIRRVLDLLAPEESQ